MAEESQDNTFESQIFPTEVIEVDGRLETVVPGGRDLFHLLPQAFEGVEQIGIHGWKSQGPAQAQNLRESLEGSGIKVKVGLQEGSKSIPAAEAAGFRRADGTLGEMYQVLGESDFNIMLIADGAQADHWARIQDTIRPDSRFGLSHGFLVGYLDSIGRSWRKDVDFIGVFPKGMGPSVRKKYEEGREINGAGINSSFAVERDVSGMARELALGWAVGLGAPYTFQTTMRREYQSDLFGERAMLLGGVHGTVEVLYRYFLDNAPGELSREDAEDVAFMQSVESVTGPISKIISSDGLRGVYLALDEDERVAFERAYSAAYEPMAKLMAEIYAEVTSGREIGAVIDSTHRLAEYPMAEIGDTPMWEVGRRVRANEDRFVKINPTTAGIYIAGMMAQVDLLRTNGHVWSEIVNESVIEATDSLNPYMAAKGVDFMVDNCSTTARLGTRKWGPQFDHRLMQEALPRLGQGTTDRDQELIAAFGAHAVHDVLETVGRYRPVGDIAAV